MDTIKSLYEQEISNYQKQVNELRSQITNRDELNNQLEERVTQLQNLIKKAHLTNQDLNTAFEHLRQENLKLQTYQGPNTQNNEAAIVGASRSLRADNEEKALERVQRQYINLAGESINWVSDKDRLTRRVKFLERECERYHRDNTTLGKQVRRLLLTLEEERGMIIKSNRPPEVPNPRTASDVIDNNLVTFESIEELQLQNQKLLSLVKELSKNEEERETHIENEDIRRLTSEMTELKSQLEVVSNDRDRALSALNTIFKERDLFRILLCKTRQVEHLTPEIFQRMVSIACSAGPAITSGVESIQDTKDKDEHITSLQKMISKLEQDLATVRNEYETSRQRTEVEAKVKLELLEKAHMKIVAETERAEALRERNEVLEKNIVTLNSEFDANRTKSQKLVFELEQLDSKNKELVSELTALKAEFDTSRTNSQKLVFELEQLDSKNKELVSELTALKAELDTSRTNSQKLVFELEQLDSKNKELVSELTALKAEFDTSRTNSPKLVFELELLNTKNKELDNKNKELHIQNQELHIQNQELHNLNSNDLNYMRKLRNIEREKRLEYSRLLNKAQEQLQKIEFRRAKRHPVKPPPTVLEPPPTVIEPLPTVLEDLPALLEPPPTVIEPLPVTDEPTHRIVEPLPTTEEPSPTVDDPLPSKNDKPIVLKRRRFV